MAAVEVAGIAYNTDLVAYVGPIRALPSGTAEFSIACSGCQPITPRFASKGEAENERKKLLWYINSKEKAPG